MIRSESLQGLGHKHSQREIHTIQRTETSKRVTLPIQAMRDMRFTQSQDDGAKENAAVLRMLNTTTARRKVCIRKQETIQFDHFCTVQFVFDLETSRGECKKGQASRGFLGRCCEICEKEEGAIAQDSI